MSIKSRVAELKRLQEALSLVQAKEYREKWNPKTYAQIFNRTPETMRDRNSFRIYLPYDNTEEAPVHIPPQIVTHLYTKGYEVSDYAAGMAKQIDGKREMKIGKLLADNPVVQQMFVNDPGRSAKKIIGKLVCISRHPYDIAGMSTDRGWSSCMELGRGVNQRYVMQDIKAGTLVAYLIRANDRNIQNPIARLLIKPFVNTFNPSDILLAADKKQYGASDTVFRKVVEKWLKDVNGPDKSGMYCLDSRLYNDGRGAILAGAGEDGTPEQQVAFIRRALHDMDMSPREVTLRDDKEVCLESWSDMEDFCSSVDDSTLEYLISLLEHTQDLSAASFSDPSQIREVLVQLPDDCLASLCERFGVKHVLEGNKAYSAMVDRLSREREVGEDLQDSIENSSEILDTLLDRIDDYCATGWNFELSQVYLHIPTEGDRYSLSGAVELRIRISSLIDMIETHQQNSDGEDHEDELRNLGGWNDQGWSSLRDEDMDEWRGRYADNTLVDNDGDDLVFGSKDDPKLFVGDDENGISFVVNAYTQYLRGNHSTHIKSPDQPDMFESDMRRFIDKVGRLG